MSLPSMPPMNKVINPFFSLSLTTQLTHIIILTIPVSSLLLHPCPYSPMPSTLTTHQSHPLLISIISFTCMEPHAHGHSNHPPCLLNLLLMSFIPHPLIFIISTCMKPHACGHLHSIPIYPSCMQAVIPISSSYLSLIADIITMHTTPFLFSTASPVPFHHSRPAVSTPITIRTRVLQDQ